MTPDFQDDPLDKVLRSPDDGVGGNWVWRYIGSRRFGLNSKGRTKSGKELRMTGLQERPRHLIEAVGNLAAA